MSSKQVKLGVDAPKEIVVHREEKYKIANEISAKIERKGFEEVP